MQEISSFKKSLDDNLDNLRKLPSELKRLFDEIESTIANASEKISKGLIGNDADITVNIGTFARKVVQETVKRLPDIGIGIFIEKIGDAIINSIYFFL